MSRIATLGMTRQDIYLLDRDDFAGVELSDEVSVFSKMHIGDQVDIDHIHFDIGGGATNAAVTFARGGNETIVLSNLSHDTAGEAILAQLDRENIDSSYLNFVKPHTDCAVVLIDVRNGNHTTLLHRGASRDFSGLTAADLESIQPDWLYVTSLGGDMYKLLEFFEKARRLKIKIMFNPGPAELEQSQKLIGLLELVDVLLVNKAEAAQIVTGSLLEELAGRLHNYCETVIITDGIMGALAVSSTESYRLGVYEQGRMRDHIGAGDAFGSGFLAKWAEGAKFRDALWFAAANASLVTQQYGAETGILTGEEKLHPMAIQRIK